MLLYNYHMETDEFSYILGVGVDNFDFEYYDEHCHPWEYNKVSMEIHIPVKLKEKN